MAAVIDKQDLKTQVHINLVFSKNHGGPLGVAAKKLAQLWMTQLPEEMQKDILRVEGLDLSGF